MFPLEFSHELDQLFRAFDRHRVVNRSAHAANGTMSLETNQTIALRFLCESSFQFFGWEAEWNVHHRAGLRLSMTAIESAALINRRVDRIRFLAVNLFNLSETAKFLCPLEDE